MPKNSAAAERPDEVLYNPAHSVLKSYRSHDHLGVSKQHGTSAYLPNSEFDENENQGYDQVAEDFLPQGEFQDLEPAEESIHVEMETDSKQSPQRNESATRTSKRYPEAETAPRWRSQERPAKAEKPPLPFVRHDELDKLQRENEKLVAQLFIFTDQMETRMEILKNRSTHDYMDNHVDMKDHPELKEMMNELGSKSK